MMEEEKLKHIAERIAMDVILRIRFESGLVEPPNSLNEKYILEEIVSLLSEKI